MLQHALGHDGLLQCGWDDPCIQKGLPLFHRPSGRIETSQSHVNPPKDTYSMGKDRRPPHTLTVFSPQNVVPVRASGVMPACFIRTSQTRSKQHSVLSYTQYIALSSHPRFRDSSWFFPFGTIAYYESLQSNFWQLHLAVCRFGRSESEFPSLHLSGPSWPSLSTNTL
ncbi:hypothetical protein BO82DRAFT_31849 [Aspergillus uvarum CBS 121591]|uniref:Uncharacterized protein n=1 Tax=Aspergillus uvarum CBS 121591 TaxID=1448315 RepID=A0A319CZ25_9EURO|nr:hypothetical protein BO82DRAFT_31849 [Aspergillus uvarum CBS 121591]PYH84073.1 hypothetical protein BO82DRAFT_31849 [Aspergillus uvarum CBS 121591]